MGYLGTIIYLCWFSSSWQVRCAYGCFGWCGELLCLGCAWVLCIVVTLVLGAFVCCCDWLCGFWFEGLQFGGLFVFWVFDWFLVNDVAVCYFCVYGCVVICCLVS